MSLTVNELMSLRVVVGQRLNAESGRQFKGDEKRVRLDLP
jgi:hypothetical protein